MKESDLNRLIDTLLHPYFKDKRVVILDGIAHAVVESDLKRSIRKFVKYNLKELLK